MSEKAEIRLKPPESDNLVAELLTHDPKLIGKKAKFAVKCVVDVKDKRPVYDEETLLEYDFVIRNDPETVRIPMDTFETRHFTPYDGKQIHIHCVAEWIIDDKWIRKDTKIQIDLPLESLDRAPTGNDAKKLIKPKDIFSFAKNLAAIETRHRILALAIRVPGPILLVAWLVVGIHDYMAVPEHPTWLLGPNMDNEEIMGMVFLVSFILLISSLLIWVLGKKHLSPLRKYMTFEFNSVPSRVERNTEVKVGSLIKGVSRISLDDVTLRIVACNMEKGQYVRGSGTDRRTVSFRSPVQGLVLFEKTVMHIPKGEPVESCFPDELSFAPVFETLYPPNNISSTHGLEIYWEVQFIHNELVDQELVGDSNVFSENDFYKA